MAHTAFRELAAGAVLEDLDPTERERLDDHLAGCPACLALGEQLDDVAWDLALLVPEMSPPRSLHGAVFDALLAAGMTGTSDQAATASTGASVPIPIGSARCASPGRNTMVARSGNRALR